MDRRTFLQAGAVTTAGLALPVSSGLVTPAAGAPRPRLGKVLARDLRVPWGIAFLPNGNALVGERDTGRVHLVRRGGGRRFVDRVPGVQPGGEGGLLGLALDPAFRRSRWVYAYLTTRSDNRIVRMRYTSRGFGRPDVVLAGIPRGPRHNGGALAFGIGGLLYASTGDANRPELAQRKGSLAGKVLRMTPGGGVPGRNPFGNHVWSTGHRNVEGLAVDRDRLWASEFGERRVDELNLIRRGHNYGWPRVEGGDGAGPPFHDPLATWPTDEASPGGLAVRRGWAYLGALQGECLLGVRLYGPGAGRKERYFEGRLGRVRSVRTAPDGSLWITTSNRDGRGDPAASDDRVIRVTLG